MDSRDLIQHRLQLPVGLQKTKSLCQKLTKLSGALLSMTVDLGQDMRVPDFQKLQIYRIRRNTILVWLTNAFLCGR